MQRIIQTIGRKCRKLFNTDLGHNNQKFVVFSNFVLPFQFLDLQVAHLAGEALDVPDDQLAVPRAGGDGAHAPLVPGVNSQLRNLNKIIIKKLLKLMSRN